jgi:membrane protease YdiL (CAAX protease family)
MLGAALAIAFVSIWFGALHGPQLWPDWIGAVYITGMGTIWTLQRHFTGSLVPSLISHSLHNGLLMAMVVSSMLTGGE